MQSGIFSVAYPEWFMVRLIELRMRLIVASETDCSEMLGRVQVSLIIGCTFSRRLLSLQNEIDYMKYMNLI